VTALALAEAAGICAGRAPIKRHWAVGIANSAPFSVLSGQRCMIDFCRV
jgi:hypothetical protein